MTCYILQSKNIYKAYEDGILCRIGYFSSFQCHGDNNLLLKDMYWKLIHSPLWRKLTDIIKPRRKSNVVYNHLTASQRVPINSHRVSCSIVKFGISKAIYTPKYYIIELEGLLPSTRFTLNKNWPKETRGVENLRFYFSPLQVVHTFFFFFSL